jgi:uncharacterized protein (TIGR00255 family)
MINSMTAFASRTGALGPHGWQWEVRGVNGRGLDLRLRVPDGVPGLEQALRSAFSNALARGNVTVNLRLNKEESSGALVVDPAQLDRVLRALDQVQDRAFEMGVTLGQPTAADVLSQRGVLTHASTDDDADALRDALLADLAPLLDDFTAMRSREGAALRAVLTQQLDEIAGLVTAASNVLAARTADTKAHLKDALRRVVDDVAEVEEGRIAQELALIAVKSDVTEEIDRLKAHVDAAQALLGTGGPVGRKLDFLAQEFNREANTLCAKAQYAELTAIGLDLKAVIDQMREQIQNVE